VHPESLRDNWPWFAAGLLLLVALYLLGPIMTPFVVGGALAYVGDPIVDRLQRWRLSRTAGVCVVFVVVTLAGLLIGVLIVPLLQRQAMELLGSFPDWLVWLQNSALPRLGLHLPDNMRLDPSGLRRIISEHWGEATDVAKLVWDRAFRSSAALLTMVANALLVPVVTFYLLRDWDLLVEWVRGVIPPRFEPKVSELARETDEVLGAFIRGQLSVMLGLGLIYTAGLYIVGLDLALLIGLGAGLVSFVPYLGFILGFTCATIAIIVQTQELLPVVWVAMVFGIGQVAESAILTPWLVGDRIGLHPVAVIFAVMAGGQLFGFMGVLLALPVAAVLAVLMRHAKLQWLRSRLYAGDLPADAAGLPAAQERPPRLERP
jgi:predicted PurR-regulated permease PerM